MKTYLYSFATYAVLALFGLCSMIIVFSDIDVLLQLFYVVCLLMVFFPIYHFYSERNYRLLAKQYQNLMDKFDHAKSAASEEIQKLEALQKCTNIKSIINQIGKNNSWGLDK